MPYRVPIGAITPFADIDNDIQGVIHCTEDGVAARYNEKNALTSASPTRGKGCKLTDRSDMDIKAEVIAVLDEVLNLKGRASTLALDTPLLGAIPELDSMAVIAVISGLEERFDFIFKDDEFGGSIFASLASLIDFVQGKRAA